VFDPPSPPPFFRHFPPFPAAVVESRGVRQRAKT
jgi:hypothetical protein